MALDELHTKLVEARSTHAKAVARATKIAKGVLILVGALVAGAAQFWTWPRGQAPSVEQVIGIAACTAVFIGGLFVASTESDAAEAIEVATKALDAARESQAQFDSVNELFESYERLAQTYQICLSLRGMIEQGSIGTVGDTSEVIRTMFEQVVRELVIAAGFAQADRWTLGIYRATPTPGSERATLKCIAHDRAIKCSVNDARAWPEGVGIAGIAYTNAREIVVPDLRAEGMAAVFGPKDLVREYDAERYVSMVAVPIMVAGYEKPWGVVNATSDRAGHFSANSAPGFKPDEPIRALAAFVAMAVANLDAAARAPSSRRLATASRDA